MASLSKTKRICSEDSSDTMMKRIRIEGSIVGGQNDSEKIDAQAIEADQADL
jgi:hypothetical protein